MDRRKFASLLPALLAAAALTPEAEARQQDAAAAQGTMDNPVMGQPTPGPNTGKKPTGALAELVSGVYTPGKGYGSQPGHESHRYLMGMLKAGNIQLEIHESIQQPGAKHERTDKHLHNELWLVKEGICELTINGVTRRMNAGDVGLVCAGDLHYVRNAGETQCTYFVVTLGPPEANA